MKFGAEIVDFRDSKFYNTNFSDKLLRLEARPKEDDPSKVTLALVFEDADGEEKELWLWGLEKTGYRKDPKDGKLRLYNNTSTAAGRYLQSLKLAGIDWDVEPETGGIPTKIGTKPDITGKINNMVIVETTKKTDGDNEKTFLKWGLQSVEGINAKAGSTPDAKGTALSPKVDATAMLEPFYEWMVNNVKAPMTEAQISKKIIETKAGADYNKVRRACLIQLSSDKDGRVIQDLTDEKNPKYSVA